MLSVELKGSAELQRRLSALGATVRGEALSAGLRAAAFRVEFYARAGARVDTGFMRSSIYTKTDRFSGYSSAGQAGTGAMLPEADLPNTGPGEYVAVIACGAEYGIYNEYGTSRMSAQPFMRPALNDHVSELEQIFAETVRRVIEGAA